MTVIIKLNDCQSYSIVINAFVKLLLYRVDFKEGGGRGRKGELGPPDQGEGRCGTGRKQ